MEKSKRVFAKTAKKQPLSYIPRFSSLPSVMKVRLRTRTYDTGAAAASPVYTRYGLLEPLNLDPTYMAALFTLYKRARVHASTIHLRLVNMGSEPIEMVVNALPHNWSSGTPSVAELLDKPGSRRALVSGAGGMDRASVTKSISSKSALGSNAYLSDYDFDETQANSATPIQADEPAWVFALTALNSASNISYRLEVVIEYDFEFYDQTSS
jgi:hypothetical protein